MKKDYYNSRESVENYIKISQGFDGKELINQLKTFLPKGSSILELGTGPGTDLQLLSQNYVVTGSDYSQHFLDILHDKNVSNELVFLDAITLKTKQSYDCIYSNKVLQHLQDNELIQSIKNQLKCLNQNGIVCHSFWHGDECYEMKGALHNYHTINEIKNWFSPYFNIHHLDYYQEMDPNDSILLIGEKRPLSEE